VLVNVVGFAVDEFARVVEGLDETPGVDGFELNVSCPNVKAGGAEFGADPVTLRVLVEGCRRVTRKPLVVKLSPVLPQVAEFAGGMINAVGLANPGLEAVRRDHLPRLAALVSRARVLVNVVGFAVDEFARVVEGLDETPGVDGFELNVSCPNVKAGGAEFGADPVTLRVLVEGCRRVTRKPLVVKLSPVLPQVADVARLAVDAGADALTLTNTVPGLVVDVDARRPALGFGSGGVSGAGLVPIGVLATWRVRQAVRVPLIGLGGVRSASDALQYLLAGASLVAVGTAAMQDPRVPERIVRDLGRWCDRHGVARLADVVGTLQWTR
jgi:dihydroorotate dehydrogenase (NAD+) catalytic subunit